MTNESLALLPLPLSFFPIVGNGELVVLHVLTVSCVTVWVQLDREWASTKALENNSKPHFLQWVVSGIKTFIQYFTHFLVERHSFMIQLSSFQNGSIDVFSTLKICFVAFHSVVLLECVHPCCLLFRSSERPVWAIGVVDPDRRMA